MLLYEALCGRKPFEGDDPFALATAIRDGAFEPPTSVLPDADPGIVAVIETAMRLDPADRYESAEQMAAALLGGVTPDAEDTTATIVMQGSDDTTATMAAATTPLPRTVAVPEPEADGNETVPVPRVDRTARLPYQAPAPRPARSRRHSERALIVAGAILALVLITVFAIVAFTGPVRPPPASDASSLPVPLEDALTRLEESVQP